MSSMAILAVLWCDGCNRVGCTRTIRREVPSPDNRLEAVLFTRSCPLGRTQTAISIRESNEDLNSGYPNVFVLTYADNVVPEEGDSVLARVSLSWATDSSLSIEYDPRSKILYQVVRLWGILVKYKKLT